jgi:hypothetical protein
MTSGEIIKLLEAKHTKDLFVAECKNGSSWFTRGLLMLDALVIKRSWSNPLTTGYEIKVSRNDFVRDDKWPKYLDYCNEFYFVCPPDIIQPNELADGVGLYWVSKQGKRLFLKKKAAYRKLEIPSELYLYILMCRTKIVDSTYILGVQQEPVEYWRRWLKEKAEKRDIGYRVSESIRRIVQERIEQVSDENDRIRRENEGLQEIKDYCEKLGIKRFDRWGGMNRIQEAASGMPSEFLPNLDSTIQLLTQFKRKITDDPKPGRE